VQFVRQLPLNRTVLAPQVEQLSVDPRQVAQMVLQGSQVLLTVFAIVELAGQAETQFDPYQ
jgi:hypothetical protein